MNQLKPNPIDTSKSVASMDEIPTILMNTFPEYKKEFLAVLQNWVPEEVNESIKYYPYFMEGRSPNGKFQKWR